jgi:predicted lipoprotein
VSELSTAARKMVEEVKALNAEIAAFCDPPSRSQIEALQGALNELQRRLNRIQVETDTWSEEKEASRRPVCCSPWERVS